jgi:hypothetical protein
VPELLIERRSIPESIPERSIPERRKIQKETFKKESFKALI